MEQIERDMPECERELEKIRFADTVRTKDGIEGKVVELDGEQYHVYNKEEVGWFTREELTLVK